VDAAGVITVVGATGSGDFPTVSPIQASFAGVLDSFVATIDPATPALTFSTYFGGSAFETGFGVALDGTGGIYFVGYTESADFPTTPGTFQPTFQGPVYDGFVVKLVGPDVTAPNVSQSSCTPVTPNVFCTADITDASGVDAAFIAVTIDFINTEVHAVVRMGELTGAGSVRFTNMEVNAPITILDSTLEAEVQFSQAEVNAPVTIQDSTLLKKYCISGVVPDPITLVGVVVDQMQNCGGGK
jgi:hypothetical protein